MASKYFKGPFRADFNGGYIFNVDGFMFAMVRGWGELSTKEGGVEAARIQDEHLKLLTEALNEKWEKIK